jgi:putative toxin-antitoxin system antitoxin component (TIGR02293 family)
MPIMEFDEREKLAALDLLGGDEALGGRPQSSIEIHDMIVAGFPSAALGVLRAKLPEIMEDNEVVRTLFGVSAGRLWMLTKIQDHLDPILSDRLWRFAVTVCLLVDLYGSEEAAQRTMLMENIYLQGRRPVDLMATAPGARLVWEHFKRIEYGVGV